MKNVARFMRENGIYYNWKHYNRTKKTKALTTDWIKNRDSHIDFPLITVSYDSTDGYVTVQHHQLLTKNFIQVHFKCSTMDTFLRKLLRYNIISISQLKKLKSVKILT